MRIPPRTATAVVLGFAAAAANAGPVQSKFDVTLYGYVKLDAVYDTQKNLAGDIQLFVLPYDRHGEKDEEFTMTARQTRFGFKIAGPPVGAAKTAGCIEAGFWGEEADPDHKTKLRIRLAFVDLIFETWSLRFGQDWDLFMTLMPKSVNFTYFNYQGAPGYRRPQAYVTKTMNFGQSTKLTAKAGVARTLGALMPGSLDGDLDGNGQNDGEDAGVPTFAGNLILDQKLWSEKPAKISVSGLYGKEVLDQVTRTTSYHARPVITSDGTTHIDVTPEESRTVDEDALEFESWLLMVSAMLPIVNRVTLQGAYWEGANLDAYESGLGLGINRTLLTEVEGRGGWVQLLLDVTEKWSGTLGYGVDNPSDEDLNSTDRSRNGYWMGSVWYQLNEAVTFAFEYSRLTTSYKDWGDYTNDRFHGAVFYHF